MAGAGDRDDGNQPSSSAWIVRIGFHAEQAYALLDESLREELRAEVARVCDDPRRHLRPLVSPVTGEELLELTYRSGVDSDLSFRPRFVVFEEQTLILLTIGHSALPDETAETEPNPDEFKPT